MLSTNRQHDELVELMQMIQTCVDRQGWPIPCRAAALEACVAIARDMLGIF